MTSSPLISVVMACYQVSETVSTAVASLLAQTYPNWECLLVDDGSEDHLDRVVARFEDPRIRYFRSERNRGRGWAHELALREARGEYFCCLDADDWIYPDKLQRQLNYLRKHPEVTAVSVPLALLDHRFKLVGVQLRGFAFGAALLRTQQAREVGFDPDFRRSQDFDFFYRLLAGRNSAVLPEIGYAYAYERGAAVEVVLEGLAYNRRTFKKTLRKQPITSAYRWILSYFKTGLYAGIAGLGCWPLFQRMRRQRPALAQIQAFESAWEQVLQKLP
jgi:glycosyltransferase involved in cell wall biosynthesis